MRRLLPLAASLVAGCAAHLQLPMTSGEVARLGSGAALVAYLGQPDATAAVCDVSAAGPHLPRFDRDLRDALIDGLLEGAVTPLVWGKCTEALLKRLPGAEATALLDALAPAYVKLLTSSKLQTDPLVAARLAVLHRLYVDRKAGLDGTPQRVAPMLDDLLRALAQPALGSIATRFATELLANADVERGVWEGKAVDESLMNVLAAAGNEMTLSRFALRLPSPALRDEAKRHLIRVHIAQSPFAEVRDNAAAVEDQVMRDGHNAVSLAELTVQRAWFDGAALQRSVLVEQNVQAQTARVLATDSRGGPTSVLPELSMRGTLSAQVQGFSRPLAICNRSRELDVDPCIAVAEVTLDHPLAYLDKGATFHFRDTLPMAEVVSLAQSDDFTVPVKIGGRDVAGLSWGLWFQAPQPLTFTGPTPGSIGPPLVVRVGLGNLRRLTFDIDAPGGRFVAVVENDDVAAFRVSSRGAQGSVGDNGSSGSAGSTGSECESGGPGSDGGPGGAGGPGGNGGGVHVIVACGAGPCGDAPARLAKVIVSEGGAGGPGGVGGAGGAGGSGGSRRSATTHTDSDGNSVTDDPGCSAGSSGLSGSNGPSGPDGTAGRGGPVSFEVVFGLL